MIANEVLAIKRVQIFPDGENANCPYITALGSLPKTLLFSFKFTTDRCCSCVYLAFFAFGLHDRAHATAAAAAAAAERTGSKEGWDIARV